MIERFIIGETVGVGNECEEGKRIEDRDLVNLV